MWYLRGRLRELRNSHNGVLSTAENASVRGVRRRDHLYERDCASRVNFLDSTYGHGVSSAVKWKIQVLVEEALEIIADEKSLRLMASIHTFPNDCLLTASWEVLIDLSIQFFVISNQLYVGAAGREVDV